MSQPMVTVLMPNHNSERYLRQAIQSVLDQTYADFELLIVEDASTDGSGEIIAAFDDPRIRVIPLERNEHICVALNTGLDEAKGRYVARIDSDDFWYPDKLERQVAHLEEHPECGASFTWVDVVDEDGRRLDASESVFVNHWQCRNRSRAQWLRDFFFKGCLFCHPSACFRSELVRRLGGYDNALVQLQDYDLWVRMLKQAEVYVFETPLMSYRHALKGGNVSEYSDTNLVRSFYEASNVLRRYFYGMSDALFVEAFGGDFKRQGATEREELRCEQAFLLMEPTCWKYMGAPAGLDLLARLLNDRPARLTLREKYGFTQQDFYRLTAQYGNQNDFAAYLMETHREDAKARDNMLEGWREANRSVEALRENLLEMHRGDAKAREEMMEGWREATRTVDVLRENQRQNEAAFRALEAQMQAVTENRAEILEQWQAASKELGVLQDALRQKDEYFEMERGQLKAEIERAKQLQKKAEDKLILVLGSSSWRATRMLRKLEGLFQQDDRLGDL